ncbi:hypothetical protein [Deinococcus sp. QL22]|uniref:hypothetical protein n=1 Tax=Deinococcus sp. QL22 TaxID=2939437 RepID=UPI002016D771|nr:hypothetical protein [Deinococcus sp. QL22]UQN04879.1 hypothetical protein M1R55_08055 [Deinococcus sp. QL22]
MSSTVTDMLRVLLIDDDPIDRLLAAEAFCMLDESCILVTADSGRAALELLGWPQCLDDCE